MNLEVPFLDQLNVYPKFFIFMDLHLTFSSLNILQNHPVLYSTLPVTEQFIYTHIWQIIAVVSL